MNGCHLDIEPMMKISFQAESFASFAPIYQPIFHCVNAGEDHVETWLKAYRYRVLRAFGEKAYYINIDNSDPDCPLLELIFIKLCKCIVGRPSPLQKINRKCI